MDCKVKVENKLDFFVKVVNILALGVPVKNLRPKERLLLAYLLFYNDKYRSLDVEERAKLLFNKSTRIDISVEMNIDQQTFYNLKSGLKIKKVLNDEYLSKSFVNLQYRKQFNINFILNGDNFE